ncbi:MAG: hypothetical protein KC462_08480 [Cyanobacteria bacterium HKST-UBA05]|nr:hypothetical protein [Cyanobacteria bacterium HKST-UBA05]
MIPHPMVQHLMTGALVCLLCVAPMQALADPAPTTAPASDKTTQPTEAQKPESAEADKKAYDGPKGVLDPSYSDVETLELVRHANNYLDQKVAFNGIFNSFNGLALDYKAAFRDSKDFLSFMTFRPDVEHHKIPLSELKLVYPRQRVDNIRDIQAGDKVLIRGKVFSVALGDPWVDVDDMIIIEKGPKHKAELEKQRKKAAED